MLLLILQVTLTADEWPQVSGTAAAGTYEDYRGWLAGAANWGLHDATYAQDLGPTSLQIIASKPGESLEGATLELQRLFDEVPLGQVVAVSLQAHEEPPEREWTYPTPARKCSICRYPDGLHAVDCPRATRREAEARQ